ncbi:MAG: M15 family metallopeptidase [Oxalicibacterium faecigallinarum]|uniref:M15 family metallopeptidase n=1 Tax=Oxalicibacterium faecigallinarum TaxID=573741 RepID=UPI00280A246E|nr:M15 family metallopeptidase [Oxalicibacterium faecigallinarum]MDQ7968286.1 M15 family metallopeptidase [Oxalicibacterium faecigallinarum]
MPTFSRCLRLRILALLLSVSGAMLFWSPAAHARVLDVDAPLCQTLRQDGVLRASAPVRCEQLRVVRFTYVGFDGKTHDDGEVTVLAAVADHVSALFSTLRERGFALAGARGMQHFRGDDAASMRANNTSAFNDRAIVSGSAPSLHAYGLAIDINPVQNPFVEIGKDGKAQISPAEGRLYLNRQKERPGKPARKGMAEEVVEVFATHGFTVWGGDWDAPIDYQHFQVSRALARKLAALPPEQAKTVFEHHVKTYRQCRANKSRSACID